LIVMIALPPDPKLGRVCAASGKPGPRKRNVVYTLHLRSLF